MSKKKSSKKSDKEKSSKSDKHARSQTKAEPGSIAKKESKSKKSKSKKSSPKPEKISNTLVATILPTTEVEPSVSINILALPKPLGPEEPPKPKISNTLNLGYDDDDSDSYNSEPLINEVVDTSKIILPEIHIPKTTEVS